ncbi:Eukaryotic translation initiation factor 1b [Coemansia spiralis]|uniref:Eukaryotic translation initiation factor 1b n=2 Tax=Coemansia TaxID=4863 RepID=A0A9W8G7Y8_9FUNG|nr:translation initiation factor SUI1 [Coemansia spiralis]KAJ1996046.1 Eukaryotic translation initiation factor 1b [Coemansia umbellata]KAJ2625487.1 Eukaryotic translation initiation factor 1b [Coemansia sp. RSA 1358]KAJ2680612.1 Eukaryotic translation initiation factor 1b [Coemansia spiralis]
MSLSTTEIDNNEPSFNKVVVNPGEEISSSDEMEKAKKKSKSKKSKSKKSKPKGDALEGMVVDDAAFDPFDGGDQFGTVDPFDNDADEKEPVVDHIHIRIQQRNGRKTVTTMQGLPEMFDHKKMVKYFKNAFGCIGTVVNDPQHGSIIQLSGDQRIKLRDFLLDEQIARNEHIKVHGF